MYCVVPSHCVVLFQPNYSLQIYQYHININIIPCITSHHTNINIISCIISHHININIISYVSYHIISISYHIMYHITSYQYQYHIICIISHHININIISHHVSYHIISISYHIISHHITVTHLCNINQPHALSKQMFQPSSSRPLHVPNISYVHLQEGCTVHAALHGMLFTHAVRYCSTVKTNIGT